MIHVMSTEMMHHYQIDRMWRRAEFLDLSYLRTANRPPTVGSTAGTARSKERDDWTDSRLSRLALSSRKKGEEDSSGDSADIDDDNGNSSSSSSSNGDSGRTSRGSKYDSIRSRGIQYGDDDKGYDNHDSYDGDGNEDDDSDEYMNEAFGEEQDDGEQSLDPFWS